MLRLDVIDTGPGIPQDQLRLIFEDFHQVSDGGGSAGRDPGGLGLGLGIVNRVARLLGVTVTVASEPGRGARFSVLVPCHLGQDEPAGAGPAEGSLDDLEATADTVQPAPPAARARAAAHVVVVDDEAFIRESLSLLLQGWGHRVSAFAGLTDLTESLLTDTLSRPDVILADFRLPNGRTGVEAVALTRAHFRKPIPAMLLTGDIDSHQLREAGRGGLPVLRKPVRPDQLRLKLVEVIGASRRAGGKNRAGGPAP
jgi:CheY-like chemotaxis protein